MGKGGGQSSTTSQTTTSAPPKYLADAYKNILNLGNQVMQLPLQQYSGPTLAGFTADQNAAFGNIAGAQGSWAPYMNSASTLVNNATQPIWSQIPQFNSDNLQKYMNPYQGSVINSAINDMARVNAMGQQNETARAIHSGSFGGSGAQAGADNLARAQAQGNASTLANLENTGYQNAQQQFMQDRGLQLGAIASQNMTDLQGAGLNVGMGSQNLSDILSQAAAQGNAGTVQQGLVQQQLNIPYQQFQQQQAYPYQQLQYFTNLASGVSGGAGGTSTGTGTVPGQPDNTFGNLVGLGLGIAGLFKDGGGVKIGGIGRRGARNGGRMSYAAGGIAPSILSDPNGYIPLDGVNKAASLSTPGMMSMPGSPPGTQPSLESMMSGNNPLFKQGLQNIGGWLGFGGSGYSTPYLTSPSGPVAADFGSFDGAPMINFRRGGIVGRSYANGGRCEYDVGGAVVHPQSGETYDPSMVATPVSGFKPVVAGTPVYGFNPLDAAKNAVTVPTAWDAIGGKNAAANKPAAGAGAAGTLGYQDFMKLMAADPGLATLFGGWGGSGALNPNGTGVTGNAGLFSRGANRQSRMGTYNPDATIQNPWGSLYTDYLKNPGQYGFKRGGIVRPRYDIGGGVGGGLPYTPDPSMMSGYGGMSMMPGYGGMGYGAMGGMPYPGYGMSMPPATGMTAPPPAVPDMSKSPITAAGVTAPAMAAHLSAPPPMNMPQPATPESTVNDQLSNAQAGLAAAMRGEPVDMSSGASSAAAGPSADAAPDSGAQPSGIVGRIRSALNDPARAGMIVGGLSMMGQHGPNASTAGVISRGLLAGIGTYASMKKANVDAAKAAEDLATKAEHFKDMYNAKEDALTVQQSALDERAKAIEDRTNALKDIQGMKNQEKPSYQPFETTDPISGKKVTKFFDIHDPTHVVDAGDAQPMAKGKGAAFGMSDVAMRESAENATIRNHAMDIQKPSQAEMDQETERRYNSIKYGNPNGVPNNLLHPPVSPGAGNNAPAPGAPPLASVMSQAKIAIAQKPSAKAAIIQRIKTWYPTADTSGL